MEDIQSSHELYIILNENGTLCCSKNKDYRIYKTIEGLKKQKRRFAGKKVAVFTLTDIKEIDDLF